MKETKNMLKHELKRDANIRKALHDVCKIPVSLFNSMNSQKYKGIDCNFSGSHYAVKEER